MENPSHFFGAVSAVIGVGTAIYSLLKARKEYHAACEQDAAVREPTAAPVRPLRGIKPKTITIAIASFLLLTIGYLLLTGVLSLRQQADRQKKQNDVKVHYLNIAADAEARGDSKAAEKALQDMDKALKELDTPGK